MVRHSLLPSYDKTNPPAQPKKKRKTQKKVPVYLCGTCGCDCVDTPQSEADQSVNCDICGVWVHYVCAGVSDQSLESVDKWFCSKCKC